MSNINDFFNKGRQYEHSPMMHVQDQKPTGTDGGASVVGDNPRDLNTVLTNEIVGASLSGNAVTLPAGEYWIEFAAMVHSSASSLAATTRVVDSNNNTLLVGFTSTTSNYGGQDGYTGCGKISLAATGSISIVSTINVAEEGGLGNGYGTTYSVYTDLRIWKLDAIKTSPILTESKLYPLPGNTYVTGNMYGLDYRKTGDHTISVDAGICMDSLNTTILTGSALQTVTIGSTINEVYNLFLCDDGIVRTDTDVNGVTLLAGSVSKLRWIGFVTNDSSGNILHFYMEHGILLMPYDAAWAFAGAPISVSYTQYSMSNLIPTSRCVVDIGGVQGAESSVVFTSEDGVTIRTRIDGNNGDGFLSGVSEFIEGWYLKAYSSTYDNCYVVIRRIKLVR